VIRLWRFGTALTQRIGRDEVSAYAAALTYNLLFSLFPLALAVTALVPAAVQRALLVPLASVVTPEVVGLVRHTAAGGVPAAHPALAYAGLTGYLLGMSAAFRRLIDAFNHAYGFAPPLHRSPWETAVLSVVLALTAGALLVVAMAMATLGQHLTVVMLRPVGGPLGGFVVAAVRWGALLALADVMLAVLYSVAPDRPCRFHWITPGAAAAIVAWLAISFGFSLYLAHFNAYNLLYGGVGAVILLLLYLYFLSYALLLGAELNALLGIR
jgi:membrane protein